VFARIAGPAIEQLQQQFPFYVWDEALGEVRWMCSWDTTEAEVDAFAYAIKRVASSSS
jgi:threonine aldolase